MSSSRCVLILLSLALLPARPTLAEAKKQSLVAIAVFDIEDHGANLGESTLNNLTQYLYDRLAEGGYKVVARSKILERLQTEKKDSYKVCRDQGCQIELGRELSAQKILTTRIIKLADTCQVTSSVYDLKRAVAESGRSVEAGCDEKSLVDAVKVIARKYIEDLETEKKRLAEAERRAEEQLREKQRREEAAREAKVKRELERQRLAEEEKRARQARMDAAAEVRARHEGLRRDRRIAGWVLGSVGLALGATGAAFAGLSSKSNDSIKEGGFARAEDITAAADRGGLYNRLGWGLGVAGLVTAGVGVGLLVFNWRPVDPGPTVSILPTTNGAMLWSAF